MDYYSKEDLHGLVKSGTSSRLSTNGSKTTCSTTSVNNVDPTPFSVFGLSSSDPFYLHEAINNPFLYPDMDWVFKPLNSTDEVENPFHEYPLPPPLPTPTLPLSSSTPTFSYSDAIIHACKLPSAAGVHKTNNNNNQKKTAMSLQEQFQLAKVRRLNHEQTWTVNGVGVDGKSDDFHDPWTWVMYGMKTLKNSTYPRRYYRCAIKSCFAVKNRQQTSEDPKRMFTVKYTGTHNHPPPPNILNSHPSSHYKPIVARNSIKEENIIDKNAVVALAVSLSAGQRSSSNSSNSSMTSNEQGGGGGGGVVMNSTEEVNQEVYGDGENNFGDLDDQFFEGVEDELRNKFFRD